MLQLRDYQEKAIEKLREGFAQGHRTQLLYLGTGGGKTEIAIAMLEAARKKGSRAAMILDRIVLCDQTSRRLDKYKVDHGVLQAGHWRYKPYEPIQVCSAQTLEKRGTFPNLDLLVIDEAHCSRKQTIEFIKNNPHIKVVGLSASPFTKGLANTYSNVVSPITTKQLVEQGSLVPLRVFIAKEVDMTGAKKVAGEWSQSEATERGIKITGDVVAEWSKKTREIFGEPRKTIVFAAGVAHGADLAAKFQEQGYNFVSISYKDDEDWKRDVIDDFAKPDSKIIGLIACDILTKGFDNEHVMIGVSARPFSKSFSSHVQQMGRVMRANQSDPKSKPFAVWLDHSGNYLRFREDWDQLFDSGVAKLEDGKEKPKKELTEKEKKDSKCPVCQSLWVRGSDTCYNCGHVKEKTNLVLNVDGEMQELTSVGREDKQRFWNQMVWLIRYKGWSRGRAGHTYRDRFGVWPRGLNDNMPEMVSLDTKKFIDKKTKQFLRSIGK
jgi:DNA repair protein RadD